MLEELYAQKSIDYLSQNGLFLISGDDKTHNIMTIGWGFCGRMWRKKTFIVPVRLSRYSHDILKNNGYFNVCIPKEGEMAQELSFCGTKSGRDVDKFKALGLKTGKGHLTPCPVLTDCDIIYECKVIYAQDLDDQTISSSPLSSLYADHDYHTMFYGEILDCYRLAK